MYVEEDLVFYDVPLDNQTALFDFMANQLEKKDYVTSEFREAIKKRENEFPTGLALDGINVSIAHTEAIYSKAKKLIVIKPKETIAFRNIEDLEPIEVDLVFGIILNDSSGHLEVLKKISQLLQGKEVIEEINQIESKEDLATFMQKFFN